jgi:hypothetical protein
MMLKNEHEDKDNDNILIVAFWCSRAPWCLLVLARALRRCPYLFLAPSASTGRQESIIRKKANGKWGLCKVDCCVLVPSACTAAAKVPWRPVLARAPALSYSFSLDKGHPRGATEKREEGGENESTSSTSIFLMCCQNFDRARAMARACHTGRARRPCRTCIVG